MPSCKTCSPVRHFQQQYKPSYNTYPQVKHDLQKDMYFSKTQHIYAILKTCTPPILTSHKTFPTTKHDLPEHICYHNTCHPERHMIKKIMSSHKTCSYLRPFCDHSPLKVGLASNAADGRNCVLVHTNGCTHCCLEFNILDRWNKQIVRCYVSVSVIYSILSFIHVKKALFNKRGISKDETLAVYG